MDVFQPISKDSVPFYNILKDFSWVDDFLKSQDLKRRIRILTEENRQLKKIPLAVCDIRQRLEKHYQLYRARRVHDIRLRISQGTRTGNPLEYLDERGIKPLILWEEVELALEEIDDGSSITEDARSEKLEEIQKNLANLQISLADVSPSRYFLLSKGEVIQDARQALVTHWHRMQYRVNAACDPRGLMLDQSPEAEIAAYKKLEIAKSINTKTRQAPHPGQKRL